MGHGRLLLATVAAWAAMTACAAAEPFTLYSDGIPAMARPHTIVAGPDGALWFTEPNGGAIGRIGTQGSVTQFTTGISGAPQSIATGPGGALWFTEEGHGDGTWILARITTAGQVTEWPQPAGKWLSHLAVVGGVLHAVRCHEEGPFYGCEVVRVLADGTTTTLTTALESQRVVVGAVPGGDGNLWLYEARFGGGGPPAVARVTPAGAVTEFPVAADPNSWALMARDPAGGVWISVGGALLEVAGDGAIDTHALPSATDTLALGPDGRPWFTTGASAQTGTIGELLGDGTFATMEAPSGFCGMTAGGDGKLWLTRYPNDQIASFDPAALTAPRLSAPSASDVTADAATIAGTAEARGTDVAVAVEYGLTTDYGHTTPSVAVAGSQTRDVRFALRDLRPGRTYHARLIGTAGSTTVTSAETTFATAPDATPVEQGLRSAPEPSMSTDGQVMALARLGDTLFIGGQFSRVGERALPAGLVDPATGVELPGFPAVTGGVVKAAVSDGSGGTILAGDFTHVGGLERRHVARLRPDGSVDPDFAPQVAGETVQTVAVAAGTVFLGGRFEAVDGQARRNLAAVRLADGAVSAFRPEPNGLVESLVATGGTVYAGGQFTSVQGRARSRLAALRSADGVPTAWNPSVGGDVLALVLDGTTLYVGGWFSTVGGQSRQGLAAVRTTDAAVTAWAPNPGTVFALARSGSTLYAGGRLGALSHWDGGNAVAYDLGDGHRLDWAPTTNGAVFSLAAAGETIYVAGEFTSLAGAARDGIGAVRAADGTATPWQPPVSPGAYVIAASAGGVLIRAPLTGVVARRNLAAVDLRDGHVLPWAPDPDGGVFALAATGDRVYAGGSFTTVAGAARHNLAAISATSADALPWQADADGTVNALALDGDTLFAGGQFGKVAGTPRSRLAAVDATGAPLPWSPGSDGWVRALVVRDGVVYAGGMFSAVAGQPRANLAALRAGDGSLTAWDARADGSVNALAATDDTLVVGGGFQHAGGQPRASLAALRLSDGGATSWDPGVYGERGERADLPGRVDALAVWRSSVLVGGDFTQVADVPRTNLAAVTLDRAVPLDWAPEPDFSVRALLAEPSGMVDVGGDFHWTDLGFQSGLARFAPVAGGASSPPPPAREPEAGAPSPPMPPAAPPPADAPSPVTEEPSLAPAPAPVSSPAAKPSVTLPAQDLRAVLARGLRLRVTCPAACTLTGSVILRPAASGARRGDVVLARLHVRLTARGWRVVRVRLGRRARHGGRIVLRGRLTAGRGARPVALSLVLR